MNRQSNSPTDKQAGKKTSNSFSTGGGGYDFENMVQGYFVVLYLLKGSFPIMKRADCDWIEFQARKRGIQTDDIVVNFKDKNQQTYNLFVQVKFKLAFTEHDRATIETLQGAWRDFRNSKVFNPKKDRIAFITGNVSRIVNYHIKPLFDYARCAIDEKAFMINFEENATEKKKRLEIIRSIINADVEVTDRHLWEFLKVVDLIDFDFDNRQGKDTASVINLLKGGLYNDSVENCENVWHKILNITSKFNTRAGQINQSTLPKELQEKFKVNRNFAPGPKWGLPHINIKNFVGNNRYLERIIQEFEKEEDMGIMVSLTGLGGIGKTYLALKTISTLYKKYRCIAWFDAQTVESLEKQFLEFAEDHHIFSCSSESMETKIKQIKTWFSNHKDALLIFDDAENYGVLKPFLPNDVDILITSVNATGWSNVIQIKPMEQEDAIALLKHEGDIKSLPENGKIDILVKKLGGLPLAIAGAGAYIKATSIDVSDYTELYDSRKKEMLEDPTLKENGKSDHPVYITFEITINKVRTELSSAYDSLSLCAFLNSVNIPRKLIEISNSDVKILNKYSLVQANTEFVSVHCVVQDVVREKIGIDTECYKQSLLRVLKLLIKEFHYDRNSKEDLDVAKQLIPHMIRVRELALALKSLDNDVIKELLGELLYRIGYFYLDHSYDSKEAEKILIEALKFVPNSKLIKLCLLKSCTKNNEFKKVKEYATEFSLSDNDIDVLCALGNFYYRSTLSAKKKPEEIDRTAKPYFEKALDIAKNGKQNERIGMIYHYLGNMYLSAGNKKGHIAEKQEYPNNWRNERKRESKEYYSKANDCYQHSLDFKEKFYDKDHLEIARAKKLLGITQFKLENNQEAKKYLQEALNIYRSFYDQEPCQDIVDTLNNLGLVSSTLHESKSFFTQALTQLESLPGDHSKQEDYIKIELDAICSKLRAQEGANLEDQMNQIRSPKRAKIDQYLENSN